MTRDNQVLMKNNDEVLLSKKHHTWEQKYQ